MKLKPPHDYSSSFNALIKTLKKRKLYDRCLAITPRTVRFPGRKHRYWVATIDASFFHSETRQIWLPRYISGTR